MVGLRDYQDAKADVILKYNPDEVSSASLTSITVQFLTTIFCDQARNLKSYGELPEYAKINENVAFPGEEEDDDNIIEFGEVSDSGSDIDDVSTFCVIYKSSFTNYVFFSTFVIDLRTYSTNNSVSIVSI